MKIVLAVFLFIHGFAHLVGFVVPWKLAKFEDMFYSTKIFYKKLDVGHTGIRIVGILWLFAAMGYFYSVYALFTDVAWGIWFTWIVTFYSFFLSIIGLPDSKFGIAANLTLLIFLFMNMTFGWV